MWGRLIQVLNILRNYLIFLLDIILKLNNSSLDSVKCENPNQIYIIKKATTCI